MLLTVWLISFTLYIQQIEHITRDYVGRVAQLVERLTMGWTVWGSNPGGGKIFRTRPDWPWGPPSPCKMGTGSFLGVKRPGCGADHPPPSTADVENEYSYTSTPPLGPLWPVTG
jgi:hypothetical protein